MKYVGFIPARGGSERVKRKNIRPFAGTTLLDVKIKQFLGIPELDRVVVDSDSDEILDIARTYPGVAAWKRPAKFATSDCPTKDYFRYFASVVHPEAMVLSWTTCPLVKDNSIRHCILLHEAGMCVVTTIPIREFLWKGWEPLNYDAKNTPRSQDLEPLWTFTGGCFVNDSKDVMRTGLIVSPSNPTRVEVTQEEAVDIDTPLDFDWAEFLYRRKP